MRPNTKASPGAEALLDSWAAHIDDLLDPQWDMMGGGHHWHPDPDAPLETVRTRLRKKFGPTGTWDGAEAGQAGVLATLFLATLLVDPWDVDGPAVTLYAEPVDGEYRSTKRVPCGRVIALPAPFDIALDTADFPRP